MIDSKQIVKISLAVLVVIILFRMINKSLNTGYDTSSATPFPNEFYEDFDPASSQFETVPPPGKPSVTAGPGVTPSATPVGNTGTMAPASLSVDLLPKPSSKTEGSFGEFAPTQALSSQNFVDASKLIGMDTVSNTLKNANYSLRRDPPITRVNTGPWMSSTYSADLMRKPLDC